MKTILTLIAISFMSSLAFAGEKFPTVIVTSTGEYEIIVDGKLFRNSQKISLTGLQGGIHYIDVFKKKKGLFGAKYRLVSSKQFELGKKDLHIDINNSGYITIGNQKKGWEGDYWLKNGAKTEREKRQNDQDD